MPVRIMTACFLLLIISFEGMLCAYSSRGIELDVESGAVFPGYSDIRIPKSTGTLISFTDELKTDPALFIRGRLTYYINRNHMLSVLVAPLKLHAAGSVDREIVFEGVSFDSNVTLSSVYKFNSYRLSYQYFRYFTDKFYFGIGLTAKVRDAAISISDSAHESEKTNLGIVPLIKFNLTWQFLDPLAIALDGDALAAPQGRAEDISLALHGRLNEKTALKVGYRVLEGGSDVEAVYSFTLINYLFAGATIRF